MSEAKRRKKRQCLKCGKLIHGTANDLTDHRSEHNFAERTGLYLAPASIIDAATFAAAQQQQRKEGRTYGN